MALPANNRKVTLDGIQDTSFSADGAKQASTRPAPLAPMEGGRDALQGLFTITQDVYF